MSAGFRWNPADLGSVEPSRSGFGGTQPTRFETLYVCYMFKMEMERT
ncbi:hypothetical protein SLEP1_g22205 [Rubroshorea leprosula]|uniref:Uncharacterized protein n=1 Tax=Rubroshorea leprosula TaxID=152421 RepID=A0AAV5JKG8_9ROSI|nr:hypothetical protein SLEP1_g22205 [Rubroshorea leprosula]